MVVSVVVSTSRKNYAETIRSLQNQTHHCEIIKISDFDHEKGLSTCRNEGIKLAKGGIVAFIDDDAIAHPTWVEEIEKSMKNSDVCFGKVVPDKIPPSWISTDLYPLFAISNEKQIPLGTNMAIRKKMLEKNKFKFEFGRRKALESGDEKELFRRLKTKKTYNDAMLVRHKISDRFNFAFLAKRSYWEGRSNVRMKDFLRHEHCYIRYMFKSFIQGTIMFVPIICHFIGGVVESIDKFRPSKMRYLKEVKK